MVIATQSLADHHETIRIDVRQRTNEDGIDERENGGVRADPEGQGENGDDRQRGSARKAACRKTDVLPKSIHGHVLGSLVRLCEGVQGQQDDKSAVGKRRSSRPLQPSLILSSSYGFQPVAGCSAGCSIVGRPVSPANNTQRCG
jgi:hypothetical protein